MINKNTELKSTNWALLAIFLIVAYEWTMAGWEKLSGGTFVSGLSKTLGFFASKNPYPWFKDFLLTTAVPNSMIFGFLVMFGELLTGIAIILGVAMIFWNKKEYLNVGLLVLKLGLVAGAFLSATFYLASGWTSVSTEALNLVMMAIQIIGVAWVFKVPRS